MIERLPGLVGGVETRIRRIPIKFNQPARPRISQEDPEPSTPTSRVPPANYPEPKRTRVESEGSLKVRDSDAEILEPHERTEVPELEER